MLKYFPPPPPENRAIYEFTDDNTAHANFMLDTEFHKRAPLICNKK